MHGALQLATHSPEVTREAQQPAETTVAGPYGPTGLVAAAPGTDRPSNFRPTSPPGLPGLPLAPASLPLPINNNSFGLATAGNPLPLGPAGLEEAMAKIDIEVNESLVGAVLGPAGRHIVEIQQYRWEQESNFKTCKSTLHSGANIQISKKGMYSPGTRNRLIKFSFCHLG